MINTINHIADKWFTWQTEMLWQVAVLIAIVAVVDLLIRKWAWPQVRYALWLLILVKLVLPPTMTLPTSLTARIPVLVEKTVKVQLARPPAATPAAPAAPAAPPIQYRPEPVFGPYAAEPITTDPPAATESPMPPAAATHTTPVASTTVAPEPPGVSLKVYALGAWLGGVFVLAGWLIGRLRRFRREHLKNYDKNALPDRFRALLEKTAAQLKLKSIPRVILTDKIKGPAVFGIFRPVLLMPADKVACLASRDIEHILLHELAHIKRGDLFVHAVSMILQIAYWFNPLIWLIRRPLQSLRELCCDATVARVLKDRTSGYRETLLETARQLLAEPVTAGMGLLGLFENSHRLLDRLRWLEKKTWKNRPLRIALILVLVGVMLSCVLPMAKARNITHHARKTMKLANRKAHELNHAYIGTEHILLALLHNDKGVATRVLKNLDIDTKAVPVEIGRLVKSGSTPVKKKRLPQTPRAESVMPYAREAATSLGHDYVSNEHILLGVMRVKDGIAAQVLANLGAEYADVRRQVLKLVGPGPIKGGHPTLVISGIVKDAATGLPIAGVKVGDDGYNDGRRSTTTESDGTYSFLTWPEHHSIKAEADGYKPQRETLYKGHFDFKKETVEQVFNFQLTPEKAASNNSGGDSKRYQNITFNEGTSIRAALRLLGKAHKKNIIISDKVDGQAPVNELYDVTFEETLQAILGPHKYIIEGDFIRVYSAQEYEKLQPESLNPSAVQVEGTSRQGTLEPVGVMNTGRLLDIAIEGRGYLKVRSSAGNEYYTRHGCFGLSPDGEIILMEPYGLMLEPAMTVPPLCEKIDISSNGTITVTTGGGVSSEIGRINLCRFMNPEKLNYIGRNLLTRTDASGPEMSGQPGDDGFGSLVQGSLELGIKDILSNTSKTFTGRTLDVAILGRGMFGLDLGNNITAFTRIGNFYINRNAEIVWGNSNGPLLTPPVTLPAGYGKVNVSYDGRVTVDVSGQTTEVGSIILYGVSYKDLLRYDESERLYYPTEGSGSIFQNEPGSNYFGILQAGSLESSSTTSPQSNSKQAIPKPKTDVQVEGARGTSEETNSAASKVDKIEVVARQFKASLPNNVTVQLAAICEYPSSADEWWRPDGTLLDSPIYALEQRSFDPDEGSHAFVVTIENTTQPYVRWTEIEGATESRIRLNVFHTPGFDLTKNTFFYASKAQFAEDAQSTAIKLQIACDPWRAQAQYDGRYILGTPDPAKGINFAESYETAEGVKVVFSHKIEGVATQLVADIVGRSGRYPSASLYTIEAPDGSQKTLGLFRNAKLADIKWFRLETRPYYYVTFKPVPLRPNTRIKAQPPEKNVGYDLTKPSDYVRRYLDNWKRQPQSGSKVKRYEMVDEYTLQGDTGAVAYVVATVTLQRVGNPQYFRGDRVYFLYRWHFDEWEGIFSDSRFGSSSPQRTAADLEQYRGSRSRDYLNRIEQGYINISRGNQERPHPERRIPYYKSEPKTDIKTTTSPGRLKARHFITIVAHKDDSINYNGAKISWPELEHIIENLSHKSTTVLEVATQLTVKTVGARRRTRPTRRGFPIMQSWQKAARLVTKYGLEYLSFIGEYQPDSPRGPISLRFEERIVLAKEIPVGLPSFEDEEKTMLDIKSIKFEKSEQGIDATIKFDAITYPQKSWEIAVKLLDQNGKQLNSVVQTYDNGGIARGYPLNTAGELTFSFEKAADSPSPARFQVELREFLSTAPVGGKDESRIHPDSVEPGLQRSEGVSKADAEGLVGRWWRAIREGAFDRLMEGMIFEDDRQKARFIEIYKAERTQMSSDKPPIVLRVTGGDDGRYKALTLVWAGEGYIKHNFAVVQAGGMLKIDMDVEKKLDNYEAARSMSAAEFRQKLLDEQVALWKNADAGELASMVEARRDEVETRLFVRAYADENGIELVHRQDREQLQRIVYKLKTMSNEEVRKMILEEGSGAMAGFRKIEADTVGDITVPSGASERVRYALGKIESLMTYIENAGNEDISGLSGYFDEINEFCDDLQGKNGEAPAPGEWGQLGADKIEAVLKQLAQIEKTAEGCRDLARGERKDLLKQHWQTLKTQYKQLCSIMRPANKAKLGEVDSEEESGGVGIQDSSLGNNTSAEAAFVIQKVLDRYAGIKTYSAIGELLTDVDRPREAMGAMPGITKMLQLMGKRQLKSIFTIKMARPNLYCIEWNEHIDTGLSKVGNVWSVGSGSYGLFFGKEKSFEKPLRALIGTASNMGKVQSSLFFDTSLNTLRKLRDLSQQQDGELEGVECYVISGNRNRVTYTYWVSKKDFLIRRYKSVSGGDGKPVENGGHTLSDESIKKVLEASGKESSAKEIAKMKAMLAAANETASKVKVTNTETYRNIILDQPISKEQFVPSKDIDEITEELKNLRAQYIHRLKNISPTDPNFKTDVQIETSGHAVGVSGEEAQGVVSKAQAAKPTIEQAQDLLNRWWRAIREGDVDERTEVMMFEDDRQRARFIEAFKAPRTQMPSDKPPIVVRVSGGDDGRYKALTLVWAGEGYIGQNLAVVKADGMLKIDMDVEKILDNYEAARTMSAAEIGQKLLDEQVALWKNADAGELASLVEARRDEFETQLFVRGYAEENGIELVFRQDREQLQRIVHKLKTMSNEDMRKMIVDEASGTKYDSGKSVGKAEVKVDTPAVQVDGKSEMANLPGKLVFHGRYRHRSRGRDIETPGELWIKQDSEGGINALAYLPWMGSYHLATGDEKNRLRNYKTSSKATEGRGGYEIELELQDGKALLTRNGVREDHNNKELSVAKAASFNPNTRPDSYCADNILLRGLDLSPGQTKKLSVYDWDNTGEKLVDYSIQITHSGKQLITVPAGTFEANHLVLKQITSADTWFKKRAGHVTDYWVLDNHIIVRVVRHREPYEIELLDYTYPEYLGEKTKLEVENSKVAMVKQAELQGRIQISGKVIDKRTGQGVLTGDIYSIGGQKDRTAINKDGSFSKTLDRQYLWRCSLRLSNGSYRKFGIDSRIDEQVAKKLAVHVDPSHSKYRELADEDGDGVFCDGVDCVVCKVDGVGSVAVLKSPQENRRVDFEGYFADSAAGAEALEELWADSKKDLRDADEIIDIVRNGLRNYKGRGNILRWIGNLFIWGKSPQNEKAVELMYYASGSPDRGLYGEAIYFGLSVTKNKTPEILQAMAAVAMKTDDYYNVAGRILWGCRQQKTELMACLDPYLKSEDESVRKKAQNVKEYFTDSKAFMAKRGEEHVESVRREYGDKLDGLKEQMLNGDSQTRMDTLKELKSKSIMSIADDSFLDAFAACTKDSDRGVRTLAARMLGNKFVWKGGPKNPKAIEILIPLLKDPDRETRNAAIYYGLSTVSNPDKELVAKMIATILDDREINHYGRVIWGIRRNKQACDEILKEWMQQTSDTQKAVKAYEIYEDVLGKELDKELTERFAGQKSDAHQGLAAICLKHEPVTKDQLKEQLFKCLTDNGLIGKIMDFYILENRQTAVAMFTCANLADRNAIRKALMEGPGFLTVGYMHGSIGPTGSGWWKSLDNFRKANERNRIDLPVKSVAN